MSPIAWLPRRWLQFIISTIIVPSIFAAYFSAESRTVDDRLGLTALYLCEPDRACSYSDAMAVA